MSDRGIEAALDRAETPVAHLIESAPDGPLSRLYGWAPAHRILPTKAAIAAAMMRGRVEWMLSPSRREWATSQAGVLLGEPPNDPSVEPFARRWLQERTAQTEMSWRPWAARKMPVEGIERLLQIRRSGRGVILASLHFGAMLSLHQALANAGIKVYLSGGHAPVGDKPLSGHEGRWVRTQNVWIEEAGHRWVRRGDSFEVLSHLLSRGETCWIAWDVPGPTTAHLLGRRVLIRSGLARLALETGATILPSLPIRRGFGFAVEFGEPVVAEAGETSEQLTERTGQALERMIEPVREQAHPAIVKILTGEARYTK